MDIRQTTFDSDIYLFNLGDVHRGDLCCDWKLLHKVASTIAKTENAYWVSTGDLLNCAFKTSVSDSYKSMPLGLEYKELLGELDPIAHKCLGIVGSNHHVRFEKAVGMSLDSLLCDALKMPFLGWSGLINLTVGKACYYVALHHGIGAGRFRGSKSTNLERLANVYPGADIYMEGHTHTFDFFVNKMQYVDRKRGNLVDYPAYFCTTAHFLKWRGSYGEEKKYVPSIEGCAVLRLKHANTGNFDRKKVTGDLFN